MVRLISLLAVAGLVYYSIVGIELLEVVAWPTTYLLETVNDRLASVMENLP